MFIKSLSLLKTANRCTINTTNALKRFLFTSNITYNKPTTPTPATTKNETSSTTSKKQPPTPAPPKAAAATPTKAVESAKTIPKATTQKTDAKVATPPPKTDAKPTTTTPAPTVTKEAKSLLHLLNGIKPEKVAIHSEPGSLYYPPYLNKGPDFPNYAELNINLYGYDYIVLESYYKYVESLCKSLNCEVNEAYPMPLREYKIKSYKPYSTALQTEIVLTKYQRVVSLDSVKSTIAPLLFEAIQLTLPEGVELLINEPDEIDEKFRYVPDVEIDELKKELGELK